MQTVTMSDDTADCSANVPRNRALSSKLKAYIALLETAPSSDIQRLLSTEPDFEDDFSKREVSPVRTRPIEETVGDGTVFTIMGTGVHGFDGSVSGSPMGLRTTSPEAVLSARTEQVTQPQRKRSRSPGRRSGPGAAFDEATQAAVEGNTLIGATNDREQREAKDAAELLVLRGGVVTEVEKSQRRSVDLRKQGNLNMYEADVLKQRRNIMDSPYLQEIFYSLYAALPHQENKLLTEKGYKWLYKRLYFRVVREGQRKECDDLAAAEWQVEAGGKTTMEFDVFYEAMFNFIDVWCDKGDEDSYIAYAEIMVNPLLVELGVGKDGSGREKMEVNFLPPSLGKLLKELQESDLRIAHYNQKGMSARAVYQAECERLDIDPIPQVTAALDAKGSKMRVLKLSGINLAGIGPLIDVVRMNRSLEQIYLKGCNLEPASTATFCNLVFLHDRLQVVDISGNQPVTTRGATAINRMLSRNRRITTCRFNQTVPGSLKGPLMVQLEANFHANAICREDYYYFKAAFEEMDYNKDGTADLKEMVAFFEKNDIMARDEASKTKKKGNSLKNRAKYRTARAAERVAKNMLREADESHDSLLSFVEMLGYFYPNVSQAALQRYIDQYEDESSPIHGKHLSTQKIEDIFKKYDADGSATLSIVELRDGLVASGLRDVWEKYQTAFARYDLHGNEEFSLEEFVMLMAVLDSCMVVR